MNTIAQPEIGRQGSVGWTFGVLWVAASFAGLAIAASLLLGVSQLIDGPPHKAIMGAAVGACVAAMQSWVFRRRVSGAGKWIGVSTVAWGIAAPMEFIGGLPLSIAVLAVLCGVSQWLVLRGQVSRSGWWVASNVVAWSVFLAIVGAISAVGNPAVGIAIGFALVGAITGMTLVWMLRMDYPSGHAV